MKAIETKPELLYLVDQVAFDLEELAACATDEMDDDMEQFAAQFKTLANQVSALKNQLTQGDVSPGTGEDQVWISKVRELRRQLPVYGALETINRVMKEGMGTPVYAVNPNVG